jgi:Transposase, Mutator family
LVPMPMIKTCHWSSVMLSMKNIFGIVPGARFGMAQVAIVTGEVVSPQTMSWLTRNLDEAVRQFHQAPLADEWAYLFLDGVSLPYPMGLLNDPAQTRKVFVEMVRHVREEWSEGILPRC